MNEKDDKALIENMLNERFNRFQNASDPMAQAQLYVENISDDATWVPQGSMPIKGKENIKKWAESFFSTYKLIVDPNEYHVEEPVIDGSIAYRRFTSAGYYLEISTGDSISFNQNYIDTFQKINEEWKITSHMWSSNNLNYSIWNSDQLN